MNVALAWIAAIAAGGLAWLEWWRPDRRHRAARVGATLLAVGALSLLGWRPTWRRAAPNAPGRIEASLWTEGAVAANNDPTPGHHRFALPGATAAPAGTTVLPDAAILRRRFPEIGTLRVYGDGLEAFDLEALRGLRIEFLPALERWTDAAITFVRCPRELPLGEPLIVQGRVVGLLPGNTAKVTLEAPDGTTTEAATAPAGADGGISFAVQAAPPPAAGRFVWRLRTGKTDEPLGVAVVPPILPRVLVLAGAPQFDTAALRRWFERAGGTLTARTLIGLDRYRFESAHDPPPQFTALDAPLLAGFDLVVADGRALAALPPPERDALRAAIADTGLGVLVLADDATFPDATGIPPEVKDAFFPWKLVPLGDAAGEGDRLARVGWPGQAQPVEIAVPSAPFEVAPQDGQTPLMHDSQGHTLAVAQARGRGQIALTLVRETDRWSRENDPGAFAAYWSELFSALARKTSAADAGRWTLAGGDAGPVFVDQPVELVWSGRLSPAPAPGVVTAQAGTDGDTTLALASDGGEPGRWRGTFWPRRPGWHRVAGAAGSGPSMDFFVHAAGTWPALEADRRRAATTRFAENDADDADGGPLPARLPGSSTTPLPMSGWFALFLTGAGYLWVERRRVG